MGYETRRPAVRVRPPFLQPLIIYDMKIETTFDFGDIHSYNNIKISLRVELPITQIACLPDIREIIAESLEPHLRYLNLREEEITEKKEHILLSGFLSREVQYPYRYDDHNHSIVDYYDNKKWYSVRDYMDGKIPYHSTEVDEDEEVKT